MSMTEITRDHLIKKLAEYRLLVERHTAAANASRGAVEATLALIAELDKELPDGLPS